MNDIVLVLLAGAVGLGIGYYYQQQLTAKKHGQAHADADKIVQDAQSKEKELMIKAKEKAYQILEDAKKEEALQRKEMHALRDRLEKRESLLDNKLSDIDKRQNQLQEKTAKIEQIKERALEIKKEQSEKLEKISGLSSDDAKNLLLEKTESEIRNELLQRVKKVQDESSEEMAAKARRILSSVMLRCASSHVSEISTTTVSIPSDEMKGRIIGREGRNIKAIENLTGVEIIIDDTPDAITISGFNPIRRHVAKKALDELILDGRIHPGRIEEAIEKAKREIAVDIKKAGEEAAYSVGVAGLDPKLLQILGRLKYRTSYGQNVLIHSIEVANLSAMLASELGADTHIAKKGGLLHDIGKALDHEIAGSHTEIGRDIGLKFKLSPEVIAPIYEHHDDMPTTLEAVIVKIADAISASRPGARNASYEGYLQRLNELEQLAKGFPGVDKAYAIQAGREIRIFVNSDETDDYQATQLAREIANKVEEELKYPGEIKVNLIREKRVVEYAR